MKRLAAFFMASVLFLIIIFVVHVATVDKLKANNPVFGTWSNSYKYTSNAVLKENLTKDSFLLMGSSEFNHGRGTPYHPKNVFRDTKVHPMMIGTAYTQSLYHAITVAALEDKLQNRKVVLILSPQWFDHKGVKPEAYATRFSESNYVAMLANKNIPMEIKKKMAKRSETLLRKDPAMSARVKIYNKIYIAKDANFADHAYFKLRTAFVSEKDRLTVLSAMRVAEIKNKSGASGHGEKAIDWKNLYKRAEIDGSKNAMAKNFYIWTKYYNKNIRGKRAKLANYQRTVSYRTSPEYEDLKLFLDICKERNIKVMLVMIPVNGYWYDYTGIGKIKRYEYYDKIRKIAAEYDSSLTDFSDMEYMPHFMEDTIHIGWKGWVKANEAIDAFVKKE